MKIKLAFVLVALAGLVVWAQVKEEPAPTAEPVATVDVQYELVVDLPAVKAGETFSLDTKNPDHLVYRSDTNPKVWFDKAYLESKAAPPPVTQPTELFRPISK